MGRRGGRAGVGWSCLRGMMRGRLGGAESGDVIGMVRGRAESVSGGGGMTGCGAGGGRDGEHGEEIGIPKGCGDC